MPQETGPLDQELIASVGMRLAQLRVLLDYAENADKVHKDRNQREWARTMIQSLSDIAEDADQMAVLLSANVVHKKVLNVTEVADAAKISRNAVYKRVTAAFGTEDESSA